MSAHSVWRSRAGVAVSLVALLSLGLTGSGHAAGADAADRAKTATPIKHVVVIIGENRSFDHIFATYVPKGGESVKNLLSEGIINADGSPGPNFKRAQQFQALAPFKTTYYISLKGHEGPVLPIEVGACRVNRSFGYVRLCLE